ncbi:hypothetical protein CGCS363_v008790 [Colletotrichum siamense]|uniref:uncharacterized protein n=1 Tax=Colletotrichum siamense TaxID=690259 RepID=UPI0018730C5A|nr:uncharacterized protein CGCS363_v008790 [Colletotrichum siamense]KAF5498063.1 hypothetical protein CGCS363_v008790 [Colletotrichum siamense]
MAVTSSVFALARRVKGSAACPASHLSYQRPPRKPPELSHPRPCNSTGFVAPQLRYYSLQIPATPTAATTATAPNVLRSVINVRWHPYCHSTDVTGRAMASRQPLTRFDR